MRLFVDYRTLTGLTTKNRHPLPLLEESLASLSGATCFSKLDLRSGYYQIRIASGDIPKTTFRTRYGHYEYTVMPFSLTNAPATFMALMNDALCLHLDDRFAFVYLDDVLIYSKESASHARHLRTILQALCAHHLYAKPSKCEFFQTSVEFLGHQVSSNATSLTHEKLAAVRDWPTPASVKEVQCFAKFLRRYIRNFSIIAAPLTNYIGSRKVFRWTQQGNAAFCQLKAAVTSAPALQIPSTNPDHSLRLHPDASSFAMGAMLTQDQGQGHRAIGFYSKKFNAAECNYPIHE